MAVPTTIIPVSSSLGCQTNLVREHDPKVIVDTSFPHLTSELDTSFKRNDVYM